MSKNNPETDTVIDEEVVEETKQTKLAELKEQADAIGVKYSPNIGESSLAKKIKAFIQDGSVGLDDKQLAVKDIKNQEAESAKDKALTRSKVMITNLDPKESEFTTVYKCVINKHFKLAMVIRLNQPIGLEKCLITALKRDRIQKVMPEVDEHTGKATGNFTTQSVAHYNVEFLD